DIAHAVAARFGCETKASACALHRSHQTSDVRRRAAGSASDHWERKHKSRSRTRSNRGPGVQKQTAAAHVAGAIAHDAGHDDLRHGASLNRRGPGPDSGDGQARAGGPCARGGRRSWTCAARRRPSPQRPNFSIVSEALWKLPRRACGSSLPRCDSEKRLVLEACDGVASAASDLRPKRRGLRTPPPSCAGASRTQERGTRHPGWATGRLTPPHARPGYGARRGRPVSTKDWAEVAAILKHNPGSRSRDGNDKCSAIEMTGTSPPPATSPGCWIGTAVTTLNSDAQVFEP
ncbi:unnamed protein product, partial [Prorocentrum cordatum]